MNFESLNSSVIQEKLADFSMYKTYRYVEPLEVELFRLNGYNI